MEETNFLQIFSEVIFEPEIPKRQTCSRCGRPSTVCLCTYLPPRSLSLRRTTLHILQHPNEENRPLHTVAILRAALSGESCVIYKGRRFGEPSYPQLHQVLRQKNTVLLYPGEGAADIADLTSKKDEDLKYNILLIDGTWKQASSIYAQNEFLHHLPKIQLNPTNVSEYVIRTQPTDQSLSTVECAASALECTENCPYIKEILLKPLRGLCKFQLDRGALVHQSKEFIEHNGFPDS